MSVDPRALFAAMATLSIADLRMADGSEERPFVLTRHNDSDIAARIRAEREQRKAENYHKRYPNRKDTP